MATIGSMVRRLVGHWTHAREARIAGARWYADARRTTGRDVRVTDAVYTAIASALVRAARAVRSTVTRVQAAAWVAVRGRAT